MYVSLNSRASLLFQDLKLQTDDSLFRIVDSCPLLTKLDLTSCRGIRVGDRRRFFEVRVSMIGLGVLSD